MAPGGSHRASVINACSVSEGLKKLTAWDVAYSLDMAIACAISYAVITGILARFVDDPTKLFGGMWAVVATVFVFRETCARSLDAGLERLVATCVSFALCLAYLLIFPATPTVIPSTV
jgi:uncharacterized membrane protein YgaE (UPF0421/DUF939 family)